MPYRGGRGSTITLYNRGGSMTAQDGMVRAVEAAQSAQEYCLLWFWTDWWPMCMTKAEWSGWMQAVFSALAIYAASRLTRWQIEQNRLSTQREADSRRLEMAEVALHVCSRAHRLMKRTSHDFIDGRSNQLWLRATEGRWVNMLATLDALAAKDLTGEELRIVLDSRGFAAIALTACREALQGPVSVASEYALLTLSASRWNTTEARWKLRCMTRAQRTALALQAASGTSSKRL